MKTKLNLTIEKETLKKIKLYAEEHQVSVSSMVEDYFEQLIKPKEEIETNLFNLMQKIEPNIKFPENFDWKKEYYDANSKKYGF